ncbi:arylamine N-acetyltransferase family protein [Gottfriedia luciferensis]|uniref:arylamine N-acetyltransferase family protein n=1 Tax=Gottfriedia luciferensis TaxID=178774 RepID=UPI000B4481B9|nr:arylamine N-acetyltransferase [Gottfriedia luciferensis]
MLADSYFKHIGITKPDAVSLTLLKKIHKHHLLSIPFENLDIIAKIPLSMNPSQIMKKIANSKRGGICYETNSLLFTVLQETGFNVSYISAKFWNDEKLCWNPEFSHLAILVTIDYQHYLADVGVGGGFIEPILLKNNYEYSDRNGSYRMLEIDKTTFILQKFDKSWKDLLYISIDPKQLHQFHEQFMYYQTSKETIFTQNKIVNLLTTDGRITLSDHQLKVIKNHSICITHIKNQDEWQLMYNQIFSPVRHEFRVRNLKI